MGRTAPRASLECLCCGCYYTPKGDPWHASPLCPHCERYRALDPEFARLQDRIVDLLTIATDHERENARLRRELDRP